MGFRCFYLPAGVPHIVFVLPDDPVASETGLHNTRFSTKLVLAFFSGGFYNGVTVWGKVVRCGAIAHENANKTGEVTR